MSSSRHFSRRLTTSAHRVYTHTPCQALTTVPSLATQDLAIYPIQSCLSSRRAPAVSSFPSKRRLPLTITTVPCWVFVVTGFSSVFFSVLSTPSLSPHQTRCPLHLQTTSSSSVSRNCATQQRLYPSPCKTTHSIHCI